MVYTLLCFTVRKSTLSFAEYKAYYETTHSKLALKLLGDNGPETYTRNYVERSSPSDGTQSSTIWITGTADDFEWDCVTVMTWRDEAAFQDMVKVFSDPEVARLFAEDEEIFLDRARTKFLAVGESPVDVMGKGR